jgi:hypothetical protein
MIIKQRGLRSQWRDWPSSVQVRQQRNFPTHPITMVVPYAPGG